MIQCIFVGTSRCDSEDCPGRRDTAHCFNQEPQPFDPEKLNEAVGKAQAAVTASNPYMARLMLVRGCDYRGGPSYDSGGCNCRNVCNLGNGTPIRGTDATGVSIRDCLECVKS